MEFDDERFKYFPAVETASIQDTTPKALAKASSKSTSGADLEALFNPEVILSEDGIAHALTQESVQAEVPEGGNLMDGIACYVDEIYSDEVHFDPREDVGMKRCVDGEVTLGMELRYETDAGFVSDVELPGILTVTGEVREKYREEVEEYNPSGRF